MKSRSIRKNAQVGLEVVAVRFEVEPLRFWLVTFKKAGINEAFYAVALPDGTIVEPQDEATI
jgi:hypothetical protein